MQFIFEGDHYEKNIMEQVYLLQLNCLKTGCFWFLYYNISRTIAIIFDFYSRVKCESKSVTASHFYKHLSQSLFQLDGTFWFNCTNLHLRSRNTYFERFKCERLLQINNFCLLSTRCIFTITCTVCQFQNI